MVMYCHSSLLDLCLQSLVREGGSSAPFYQSIAGLPNNLKDGLREILLRRRTLSASELACLIHPGVLSVDLSEQVITGDHLRALLECRNLRNLDFSQTLRDMRRPALREDEEMDLSSQLRLLLTKLPKLTALHLRDVEGVTADVLSVLAQCCPLLRHLELGGCPFIGDDAVLQLRSCERLECLSLARTPVSDLALCSLARSQFRDCLVELRIDSCKAITDQGIQALLAGLSGLQILIFHGCPGVTYRSCVALKDYYTAHGRTVRQLTWTVY